MIELDLRNRASSGESPRNIPIIGIGGAGANALDRLALDGVAPASLIALNTDAQALTASVAGDKIQLGPSATRGLGSGGDPELGRCAAEESANDIRASIEGSDAVILVAGLGGGTGSGTIPLAAEVAHDCGALVIAVVTLPFSFEGKRRSAQAAEALSDLQRRADAVICFENDRMGETAPAASGIQTAFAAADQTLSQCIQAVAGLLKGAKGLISLGLDDLAAILQDVNSRCLFGHGQAEGKNRSFDALSRALKNPLMDKGRLLRDCDTVLMRVTGGPDLTLDEVQLLMEEFNRYINDHTRILFGVVVEPAHAGRVSVSILSSTRGVQNVTARPARAPRAETAPQNTPKTTPQAIPQAVSKPASARPAMEPVPAEKAELEETVAATPAQPVAEEAMETPQASGFELEPTGADEPGLPVVHIHEEEQPEPVPETPMEAQPTARPRQKPRGLRAPTFQASLFGEEPAAPVERIAPPVPGRMLRNPFPKPEPEPVPAAEPPQVYRSSAHIQPPPVPAIAAEVSPKPQPVRKWEPEPEAISEQEPIPQPESVTEPEPVMEPEPASELEPASEFEPASEPQPTFEPEPAQEQQPSAPEPEPEPAPIMRQRPFGRRVVRRTNTPEPPELIPAEEGHQPEGSAKKPPQQEVMEFEPVTRGRFEKSEPTIVDGQDLDVPTYLRRRLKLR